MLIVQGCSKKQHDDSPSNVKKEEEINLVCHLKDTYHIDEPKTPDETESSIKTISLREVLHEITEFDKTEKKLTWVMNIDNQEEIYDNHTVDKNENEFRELSSGVLVKENEISVFTDKDVKYLKENSHIKRRYGLDINRISGVIRIEDVDTTILKGYNNGYRITSIGECKRVERKI